MTTKNIEIASSTAEQHKKSHLSLIRSLTKELLTITELDNLLKKTSEKLLETFGFFYISIWLVDEQQREVASLRAHCGAYTNLMPIGYRLPISEGLLGYVIRTGEPVCCNNCEEDPRFYTLASLKTKSELIVPIRDGTDILGAINIESEQLGAFSDADLILCETVADHLTLAIKNTRMYFELELYYKQLNTKIESEIARLMTDSERLLLDKQQLEEENLTLKTLLAQRDRHFSTMVGSSPPFQEMLRLVEKVAPTHLPILITGESGTGKELVARRIHEGSPRGAKQFVAINCGALQETLLESELFGYLKGAFTGANENKKGLLELAHGGTLFLDEVAETSERTQVKMLRFLQEGVFFPVGSTKESKVDVRILSATNQDLEVLVKQNRFREDLFYRLNTITLRNPPLRERKEDIPALLEHFLRNTETGFRHVKLSADAIKILTHYHWPGNIRELKNVVERSIVLSDRGVILPKDLPHNIRFPKEQVTAAPETPVSSLRENEKELILRTLAQAGHNKSLAANLLKITRKTLYNKMERYGIALD